MFLKRLIWKRHLSSSLSFGLLFKARWLSPDFEKQHSFQAAASLSKPGQTFSGVGSHLWMTPDSGNGGSPCTTTPTGNTSRRDGASLFSINRRSTMSNIPSDAWWADYENDESILADRYRSLGLELDDPLDPFTTLPATRPPTRFQPGETP